MDPKVMGNYGKQNKNSKLFLLSQINTESFILTKSALKDSSSKTCKEET